MIRVIAVFFLIYTGADLAMPEYFCGGEEIADLPPQSMVMATEAGTVHKINDPAMSSSHDSQPSQSPDQAPHEEDCFCCCSHVLPGLSFTQIGYSVLKTLSPLTQAERLLSPPLQSTYHPPRFA